MVDYAVKTNRQKGPIRKKKHKGQGPNIGGEKSFLQWFIVARIHNSASPSGGTSAIFSPGDKDECELDETEGPGAKDDQSESPVLSDGRLVEQREHLQVVRRHGQVDEEQL